MQICDKFEGFFFTFVQNIGQMRMQFWKNAVDSIYDPSGERPVPKHPVILELQVRLSKYSFIRCLFI